MTEIRLYLGAHKTATTHLQGIMLANRARLAAAGVKLSAPQDVRREWVPVYFKAVRALLETGEIPDDLATPLRDWMPATGDWILTEENIIGVPIELLSQPGIYPHARKRLATLRALFPEARIRLFFSVRGYDGFWRSMYSEIVRNRGFLPFEDFWKPKAFAKRSWVDTVTSFTEVLPEADIVLWKFEDFAAVQDMALAQITGQADIAPMVAAYKAEPTRPSLSQKALQVLGDIVPVIGREQGLKLTERINDHYAVAAGHAPFQPFDAEQVRDMRAAYARDLATIRARFPAVRWLEPAAQEAPPT
ncbi:MAG: hypothetical protein Q8K20_13765 [Gemmobacter sp.]|jgi:hypothetical protein|nr:hypothetical protein [Gemmobacter sp.]